jgi:hypothetical protein
MKMEFILGLVSVGLLAWCFLSRNNPLWLVILFVIFSGTSLFYSYLWQSRCHQLEQENTELQQMWEATSEPTMMTLEEVIRKTIELVRKEDTK